MRQSKVTPNSSFKSDRDALWPHRARQWIARSPGAQWHRGRPLNSVVWISLRTIGEGSCRSTVLRWPLLSPYWLLGAPWDGRGQIQPPLSSTRIAINASARPQACTPSRWLLPARVIKHPPKRTVLFMVGRLTALPLRAHTLLLRRTTQTQWHARAR